ncbi:MAG: 16S rRNA processing protein RimM [Parvularculaceae bacterium]|nr:16S rRNA processing protein RimM [Parvularculaceae bacterium]
MSKKKRICLGAFAGAHGVAGHAKVKTFTQDESNIAAYGVVESEDCARKFTLKFVRIAKPGLAIVAAPEISSREDAASLAGVRLYVDRAALPDETDTDEFYIEDLIGLKALDENGAPVGVVTAVHNFGAGDIVEIKPGSGRKTAILAPFTKAAMPEVDLAKGVIVIAADALTEIAAEGGDV